MMQSPPSRRRGLKSSRVFLSVTLFCRLLRGGVDWNHYKTYYHYMLMCRLLRGGVDWNIICLAVVSILLVASFAEAWIEIVDDRKPIKALCGRLLRGGVDWNWLVFRLIECSARRLLRGGVDWNNISIYIFFGNKSRLLRGGMDWNIWLSTQRIKRQTPYQIVSFV